MNTRFPTVIALAVAAVPLVACGPTEFRGTYIEFTVYAGDRESGETLRTATIERDEPIIFDPSEDNGGRYQTWIEDEVRIGFPERSSGNYNEREANLAVWVEQDYETTQYDSGGVDCPCACDEAYLSSDGGEARNRCDQLDAMNEKCKPRKEVGEYECPEGDACTWTDLEITGEQFGLVRGTFEASLCGDGEKTSRVEVDGDFAVAVEEN